MKRVLMVGPVPPPFGGIAAVLEDLVHSRLAEDYHFDVFNRSEIPVNGTFRRINFRIERFLEFWRQARSRNYDFTHIHSADPAFMGTMVFMFLAKAAGLKVLLHMHGTDWKSFYDETLAIKRLIIKLGMRLPNKVVVLFRDWTENIHSIYGGADVRVIRNLIHKPVEGATSEIRSLREELNLPTDCLLVLTIGSIGVRKGQFDILKAIPKIVSSNPNIAFVFVGGGERPGEMEQILEIIKSNGLGRRVIAAGEVDRIKVPLYLRVADIFLLPSYIEGMPISIIEAMAHGIPVISTPVGGIPDLLKNDETGLFVTPGSSDEIAEAVLKLAGDPMLRDRIGRAGREFFADKFEFSKGIQEFRNVYEELE